VSTTTDPKSDGFQAYLDGAEESANPYPADSDDHLSWNDGFNEAADENEGGDDSDDEFAGT